MPDNTTAIDFEAHTLRGRFSTGLRLLASGFSLLLHGNVRLAIHADDQEPRVQAAQWVARQYFEIAAEQLGEDAVRERMAQRISAEHHRGVD